jgi:hypothetical protein
MVSVVLCVVGAKEIPTVDDEIAPGGAARVEDYFKGAEVSMRIADKS